jgi:predicted dehydrogenase
VGCGRLAERGYVPAARAAHGVELAAVADIDPARCERAAPGVPAYEGARALIADARVEAVVLATPAFAHLADARLAAAAGLPALVEKPPATDAREAAALARLDPRPWIGFNRRFERSLGRMHAALPAGGPFDLTLQMSYRRRSWSSHVTSDDALLDLGPHLVDLARWLTGARVERVRAEKIEPVRAVFELDLRDGRARASCAIDRPYRERVEARGPDGRLLARDSRGGLVRGVLAHLPGRGGDHPLVASLTAQLEAFARAIRGEPAGSLATAEEGAAAMAAIEGARDSAAAGGGWEPVAVG